MWNDSNFIDIICLSDPKYPNGFETTLPQGVDGVGAELKGMVNVIKSHVYN